MRAVVLFFVFLLLWADVVDAGAVISGDIEKPETVISIDVLKNGDATWIIEKRLPLADPAEAEDWDAFIKREQDKEQYQKDITEFRDRIAWFIDSAQKLSNRNMEAKNFNISYATARTLTGVFSLIRYSFEWKNFSRIESGNILIGDAFSEGMMLSQDNVLVVKIPDGYEVGSASPEFDRRDENRLIWDGRTFRSFNRGEPAITLTPGARTTWFMIAIVMFGLVSGTSLILWHRRRILGARAKNNISAPSSQGKTMEDIVWGGEMIEQYLIRSGGEAHQSDIVRESGLSKSKISSVLAQMKEEGRILKIRKGKENLIRLIVKK